MITHPFTTIYAQTSVAFELRNIEQPVTLRSILAETEFPGDGKLLVASIQLGDLRVMDVPVALPLVRMTDFELAIGQGYTFQLVLFNADYDKTTHVRVRLALGVQRELRGGVRYFDYGPRGFVPRPTSIPSSEIMRVAIPLLEKKLEKK